MTCEFCERKATHCIGAMGIGPNAHKSRTQVAYKPMYPEDAKYCEKHARELAK
jgi:(2Fe-2S) ferredoxin